MRASEKSNCSLVVYEVWHNKNLTSSKKEILCKIIESSNEVYTQNLISRVERAFLFVVAKIKKTNKIVGICCAKHPYLTYKKKMLEPFGLNVKAFTYELGWLWVDNDYRFKMIGYRLVKKTMDAMSANPNFFITIRSKNNNFRFTNKLGFKYQGSISGEHVVHVYTNTKGE